MTEKQKAEIIKLRKAGSGYGKIAQTIGVPLNTVKSFCRRNTVLETMVEESEALSNREITSCDNCGKSIMQIAKQKKKRFCCDKCRNKWWNGHLEQVKRKAVYDFKCPHCGKVFQVYGDKRRKYCSHSCYIADRFKGGASNE